jgi:hypothetical protein
MAAVAVATTNGSGRRRTPTFRSLFPYIRSGDLVLLREALLYGHHNGVNERRQYMRGSLKYDRPLMNDDDIDPIGGAVFGGLNTESTLMAALEQFNTDVHLDMLKLLGTIISPLPSSPTIHHVACRRL